jgi:hypothetical protein
MSYQETILACVNAYLDEYNVSTSQISKQLGVSRKAMLNLRNGDKIDANLLLDVFDHIFPDKGDQDRIFINEKVKDMSLKELKTLYKNKDLLLEELNHIKKYQYNDIMNDVLARICMKNSRNILREKAKHESNTLL